MPRWSRAGELRGPSFLRFPIPSLLRSFTPSRLNSPFTPFVPRPFISHYINNVVSRLGMLISWVWVILLVVIVVNVLLRYAFSEGRVEFEEIQWHLYSFGFLLGIPYAIVTD